jgi:hypothetical protein
MDVFLGLGEEFRADQAFAFIGDFFGAKALFVVMDGAGLGGLEGPENGVADVESSPGVDDARQAGPGTGGRVILVGGIVAQMSGGQLVLGQEFPKRLRMAGQDAFLQSVGVGFGRGAFLAEQEVQRRGLFRKRMRV